MSVRGSSPSPCGRGMRGEGAVPALLRPLPRPPPARGGGESAMSALVGVGSRRSKLVFAGSVYLGLIAITAVSLFPLLWVIGLSLKTRLQVFAMPPLFVWWPMNIGVSHPRPASGWAIGVLGRGELGGTHQRLADLAVGRRIERGPMDRAAVGLPVASTISRTWFDPPVSLAKSVKAIVPCGSQPTPPPAGIAGGGFGLGAWPDRGPSSWPGRRHRPAARRSERKDRRFRPAAAR